MFTGFQSHVDFDVTWPLVGVAAGPKGGVSGGWRIGLAGGVEYREPPEHPIEVVGLTAFMCCQVENENTDRENLC